MLPLAREVDELEVDHLSSALASEGQNFRGGGGAGRRGRLTAGCDCHRRPPNYSITKPSERLQWCGSCVSARPRLRPPAARARSPGTARLSQPITNHPAKEAKGTMWGVKCSAQGPPRDSTALTLLGSGR